MSGEGVGRWLRYFALGLASRLLVVLLGYALADRDAPPGNRRAADDPRAVHHSRAMQGRSSHWIDPWYRWDAVWYADIGESGYAYRPGLQNSVAFLPLLPLITAAGAGLGLDRYWVGLVAANLAFSAGLAWFALAVVRATGDPATARRSCLLLVAYPWSFFFSAPYQESFGFCLGACGLWAWLARRPAATAMASGLASAARVSSVALGLGIVAEWACDAARGRPTGRWALPVAASGLAGVLSYFAYLKFRFGDPFLYIKAHGAWGRKPASLANLGAVARESLDLMGRSPALAALLVVLLAWIGHRPAYRVLSRVSRPLATIAKEGAPWIVLGISVILVAWINRGMRGLLRNEYLNEYADVIVTTCFLALGARAWVRRGPLWGVLTFVPIALALVTGSALSMTRLALAAYPAFLEAGAIFKDRASLVAISCLMLGMQVLMIRNYVHWYFCG